MYKTEILIAGGDKQLLQTALRLINDHKQWKGTIASTAKDAIEKFHHFHFDVVVLIHSLNGEDARKLRSIFMHQDENLILLQREAATAGEPLVNRIETALEKRRGAERSSYLIIDDALKGAALDIQIQ